ncbi:MAG: hypothetical protein NT175_09735 [Bacteroidetes bacterium]|nr:hypothetical protein [Bacteroidota bacterium]
MDENSGEHKGYNPVKYRNLTFKIINRHTVLISGSPHKYKYNRNDNDFYFSELLGFIIDLFTEFNLNPYQTIIQNIEFAVNLEIPITPRQFIQRIISHRGSFPNIQTFNGKGYFVEFTHQQYYIKIYDKYSWALAKGKHPLPPINTLRFEIKVIKMEYVSKVGIRTLADLLNISKLRQLGAILVTIFNELLIDDPGIDPEQINATEGQILTNGRNPRYWEQLKPDSKKFPQRKDDPNYQRRRNIYDYTRERFIKIIQKYSNRNLQTEISEMILNKWDKLLTVDNEISGKLTDFLRQFRKPVFRQINILTIGSDCQNYISTEVRICQVTGINISDQKSGSHSLSEQSVRRIFFIDKKTFYFLYEKFLPQKTNLEFAEVCYRIAHNIRNSKYNPHNNLTNRIKRLNKDALFASDPYIVLQAANQY